jgi:hypothetical protein
MAEGDTVKIYLDRSVCNDSLPTCERRMARLIRFPLGEDRPCITAIEDDGKVELTLVVKSDGKEATIVLDEQARELAGMEGLSSFLPWSLPFYRSNA